MGKFFGWEEIFFWEIFRVLREDELFWVGDREIGFSCILVVSLGFLWVGCCWIRNWIFMLGIMGRSEERWCLEVLFMENCWGIECFEEVWLKDFFERRSEGDLSA